MRTDIILYVANSLALAMSPEMPYEFFLGSSEMGAALSGDRTMRVQVCLCDAMSTAGWQSMSADREDEEQPGGTACKQGRDRPGDVQVSVFLWEL